MSRKVRESKFSISKCKQAIQNFFTAQTKFKEVQSQFNSLKAQFNSDMEDYFKCEGIDKSITFTYNEDEVDESTLVVNRIQKSNVEFDPDKLETALGKKLSKDVIIKRYEIVDIDALITYLKECNVDPKVFRSFLNIIKSVNTQELDRLEELGKITAEQVKGCYTIKYQKPYFTVGVKKGHDNENQS